MTAQIIATVMVVLLAIALIVTTTKARRDRRALESLEENMACTMEKIFADKEFLQRVLEGLRFNLGGKDYDINGAFEYYYLKGKEDGQKN